MLLLSDLLDYTLIDEWRDELLEFGISWLSSFLSLDLLRVFFYLGYFTITACDLGPRDFLGIWCWVSFFYAISFIGNITYEFDHDSVL